MTVLSYLPSRDDDIRTSFNLMEAGGPSTPSKTNRMIPSESDAIKGEINPLLSDCPGCFRGATCDGTVCNPLLPHYSFYNSCHDVDDVIQADIIAHLHVALRE